MKNFTRDDFMGFFRDDEKLNTLSVDDRLEIFAHVLPYGSVLTVEFLQGILNDYDTGIEIKAVNDSENIKK